MINNVVIMGRLTADPELRTTASGISVVTFSLAVQRYVAQGKEPEVDFFTVVAWRKTAEFVCQYLAKGSRIVVSGFLQTRNYTDRNNIKRYVTEIVARDVDFADSKKKDTSELDMEDTEPFGSESEDYFEEILTGDDLPF